VNTCGFLDSAKAESLEAIGEAIAENGRVVVTGCMGKEADLIRERFPAVLAVTGPQQYDEVVAAVHDAAPPSASPFTDLVPEAGLKLTPRHYSYLKISEGCNHRCAFCIIPHLRGDLQSRRPDAILREAEKLVAAGTKELLVISQDTSAYGLDLKHASWPWKGGEVRAHMTDLVRELGKLGAWVRLHYVYPYPHVDSVDEHVDRLADLCRELLRGNPSRKRHHPLVALLLHLVRHLIGHDGRLGALHRLELEGSDSVEPRFLEPVQQIFEIFLRLFREADHE
jgi:ribosomal protein S12 methylthiotransferase